MTEYRLCDTVTPGKRAPLLPVELPILEGARFPVEEVRVKNTSCQGRLFISLSFFQYSEKEFLKCRNIVRPVLKWTARSPSLRFQIIALTEISQIFLARSTPGSDPSNNNFMKYQLKTNKLSQSCVVPHRNDPLNSKFARLCWKWWVIAENIVNFCWWYRCASRVLGAIKIIEYLWILINTLSARLLLEYYSLTLLQ